MHKYYDHDINLSGDGNKTNKFDTIFKADDETVNRQHDKNNSNSNNNKNNNNISKVNNSDKNHNFKFNLVNNSFKTNTENIVIQTNLIQLTKRCAKSCGIVRSRAESSDLCDGLL